MALDDNRLFITGFGQSESDSFIFDRENPMGEWEQVIREAAVAYYNWAVLAFLFGVFKGCFGLFSRLQRLFWT